MTYVEIEALVRELSPAEQIRLIEAILQRLRGATLSEADARKLPITHRSGFASPPALRRGMLKPDEPISTDDDLREDYTTYLMQKHLK